MESEDKAVLRHSQRRRPVAFFALLDLNRDVGVWLDTANVRGPVRRRIANAILRAATALTHAAAGRDTRTQLTRVQHALATCETAFFTLASRLAADIIYEAIRRIDRIVAAVEQLARIEVSRWTVEMLPPEPAIARRLAARLLH